MESMPVIKSQSLQRSILGLQPGKGNFIMIKIASTHQKRKSISDKVRTFLIPQMYVVLLPEQCQEFHSSILEKSLTRSPPAVPAATFNLLPVPSSVSSFKFGARSRHLASCPLPDKECFFGWLKKWL